MKKIILIQPKVGSWEFIQDVPMVPLSLLAVASGLVDRYEIRILDQRLDRDWAGSLRKELQGDVLCVGVTAFTGPQILYALEASRLVKEHSAAPVIWGGIHPSILPAQTVSHEAVDFVLVGEGEVAFPMFVRALEQGTPPRSVPGIWAMENGQPQGSHPETIQDIDSLPSLPYQLVHLADYIGRDRRGRRTFAIKTSRGCPYRCTFCHQNSNYRKKWRAFGPGRVLDEMQFLATAHGVEHFQILDDNFFVDTKRTQAILSGMAERGLRSVITINGSRVTDILRLGEDSLRILATHCVELQIGLESGSQRILDVMKKDTSLAQVRQANERLKQYRIPRYYELVAGFPEETREDIAETARLILHLSEDDPDVFFAPLECLNPYPGTEVYGQAVAAGMQFPTSLEGWGKFEWSKADLPWLDGKKRRMLESFHLFPTLISSEIKVAESGWMRFLFRLYRPIARWRVRHLFFGLPVESLAFRLFTWIRS
jgi:anaerobic magnesium-protoporphyrin IX monomethyl ester cyclase